MVKTIVKRDGREKEYSFSNISNAIKKAYKDVYKGNVENYIHEINIVENIVKEKIDGFSFDKINIEDIQDIVVFSLNQCNKTVAASYQEYRERRTEERERNSSKERYYKEILECSNIDNDNANVDQHSFSGKKYRIADNEQKIYALRNLLSPVARKAFEDGLIYPHDLSSYAIGEHNCLFADLDKSLLNGFETRNGDVRTASSYATACQLIAVIFQCQSQVQYGGVASNHLDFTLAEFVKRSFKKHFKQGVFEKYDITCDVDDNLIYIDNELIKKSYPKAYDYAIRHLEKEGKQATESLYHNLNTLESRAGSQLPFTSINLGRDISTEGRLVNKWIFNASLNGIGKFNRTSIFPISIFQYKKGINDKEGTPNYDMKKLAIKSLSKRIYPNFVNGDWKKNIEDQNNPDTYNATMGCVDGEEIITYKINNELFVESFSRMWDRLNKLFEVKEQKQKDNYYMDLENVSIYDTKNGFVNASRIIKNKDKGDWVRVKFSNGRSLLATSDHPLPIINKGRVFVKDVQIGDKIIINQNQYAENNIDFDIDKAWLFGVILCDGCYDSNITTSINAVGEDDIEAAYISIFKKIYEIDIESKLQERGKKGVYKDLIVNGKQSKIKKELIELFGGLQKKNRQIPNEVFSWSREAKLSFLAGMIDADGYINSTGHCGSIVQLGSTNKELALQTMALAQSLGLQAKSYLNHYTSKDRNKIRYRIEFSATLELLKYLACHKKIDCFDREANISKVNTAQTTGIEFLGNLNKFSYDVTTHSDYFEVSGILSHNCRTLVGYDIHTDSYIKTGRGNVSPITIILPKLGLDYGIALGQRKKADTEGFISALDNTLLLVRNALIDRYEYICKQSIKSAPFMYKNGTLMNTDLCNDGTVREAMKHGSNAIGLIGMAECCVALFGKHHGESEEAYKFALDVIERIYNFCEKSTKELKMNFSTYFTPAENLCKTAANMLRFHYGEVKGVTDRKYLTNSIHIPVWYKIDAYTKILLESPFSQYGTGGCITYVELDGSTMSNLDALENLIDYAMDLNVVYLAINFPIDTCKSCGYSSQILTHHCPSCSSDYIERLKRVTGYTTTDFRNFNEGKFDECNDRVIHNTFNPSTIPCIKMAISKLKELGIDAKLEI